VIRVNVIIYRSFLKKESNVFMKCSQQKFRIKMLTRPFVATPHLKKEEQEENGNNKKQVQPWL
jgi:hypothetical protein